MRQFLIICLSWLCVSAIHAEEKTTLYDFRFWTSPERTRIVIDVEKGVQYHVNTNANKIDLAINNAKLLSQTYDKLFYQDQRIQQTSIKRNKDTLHFLFKTTQPYQVKSYTLKPSQKYRHHRLVIDLYGQQVNISSPKKLHKIVKKSPTKTIQKIILIDAGHGGEDPGAIGYKRTKEKHITLQIAKKLAEKINQTKGMKAVLTRKDDYYVGLTKRIRIAQANNASLFISIHADSVKRRSARGASVYTLSERGGSTKFAKHLEQSQNTVDQFGGIETLVEGDQYLNKILWDFSRKDRDIQSQKLGQKILQQMSKIGYLHKKTPQKAGFVVLKTPAIPSLLVETAFISNPQEERRLNNKKEQDKIARAIYRGILNYYK